MSEEQSKPQWLQILIGIIFLIVAYVIFFKEVEKDNLNNKNSPPVAEQQAQQYPARNTFNATTDVVIEKWNTFAIETDKSFVLPQKGLWEDGGKNDKFHAIRYKIKPSVYVTIEVDNQSQKAFSLSILGAKQSDDDVLDLFNAMVLVGVTTYGKGDNAGALGRACKDADKEPNEIRVGAFNVFCSYPLGVMMAGVSVPK